jgi:adenine-specific DNA methylase
MQSLIKLLKEEYSLDNEILRNRVQQMRGLHSLIMQKGMEAPDRSELLDKIRDIEDRIEAHLVNRAKGESQRRLFTSNPFQIDNDVRKEMIRLRSRREAQDKYRSMKLSNLIHPSKKEDRSP